jgi:hypothetical protein
MIFCWKRSRLFAAFCRAARSMSGKFSIRSTGAAGHDVATDASNTRRRMAGFTTCGFTDRKLERFRR